MKDEILLESITEILHSQGIINIFNIIFLIAIIIIAIYIFRFINNSLYKEDMKTTLMAIWTVLALILIITTGIMHPEYAALKNLIK